MSTSIVISKDDYESMRNVLETTSYADPIQKECLEKLMLELEQANILSSDSIPNNIVRLGSVVDIQTPFGMKDGLTIVLPNEGDFNRKKISVISPIGSALLGYPEGKNVRWPLSNGVQTILIKKVRNE